MEGLCGWRCERPGFDWLGEQDQRPHRMEEKFGEGKGPTRAVTQKKKKCFEILSNGSSSTTTFNISAAPFISSNAAACLGPDKSQASSLVVNSNATASLEQQLGNRFDLRGLISSSNNNSDQNQPSQHLRFKLKLPSNILRNSTGVNGTNNGTNNNVSSNGMLRAFCNSLSGSTINPPQPQQPSQNQHQHIGTPLPSSQRLNLINSASNPNTNSTNNAHNRFDLDANRQGLAIPANFTHYRNENANWENHYPEANFRVSQSNGIILLKLKETIDIEMTLDGAIRVLNWRCHVAIALSSSSNSAAVIHPNGRVLQYQSRVEIMTYDGKNKNNFVRFAKIWYKGISFTSENCALVYLVDSGGTRTTTDSFLDLRSDISSQVFLTGSIHGTSYENQAVKEMRNHKCWPTLDGTEIHELNGFRISQTVDGMVRITKANKNILIRTSPGNGSATLTTPYIHCTASLGQTSHLFVRRGERRMHFDGAEFVVRNSGHSAGFDANNLLRVY